MQIEAHVSVSELMSITVLWSSSLQPQRQLCQKTRKCEIKKNHCTQIWRVTDGEATPVEAQVQRNTDNIRAARPFLPAEIPEQNSSLLFYKPRRRSDSAAWSISLGNVDMPFCVHVPRLVSSGRELGRWDRLPDFCIYNSHPGNRNFQHSSISTFSAWQIAPNSNP